MTKADVHQLVTTFYSESGTDLIGLWEIAKEVETLVGDHDATRIQTLKVVHILLSKGLLAGNSPYDMGGYLPWKDQNLERVINRIDREWLGLGHTPNIPDIVWFGRPGQIE